MREGYGVGMWKALRKWGHLVSNKMSFVVGDGQSIKFGRDRWCGDSPFMCCFSSSFCPCSRKGSKVGDVWSAEQGRGCLNPTFIRLFND